MADSIVTRVIMGRITAHKAKHRGSGLGIDWKPGTLDPASRDLAAAVDH